MTRMNKIAGLVLTLSLLLGSGAVAAMQQDQYDRITEEMQVIRGLELLDPLDLSIQSREELRDWLLTTVDEGYPADVQERDLRIMVIFGFVEPGTDLGQMQVDLLGEQIAGYYDPETSEMVVVSSGTDSDELSASDEITFAHEVVHAIQDQHYDLMGIQQSPATESDDQYLAVTALIEGDASLAQVLYMLEYPELLMSLQSELADLDSEQLDNAPPFISGTLLFPYDQGATFVMALYDEGGWDLVNQAFEDLPQSTEHILHPGKYLAGEEPIEVTAVDPLPVLGDEWTVLDVNTMGEFIINIFLDSGEVRPITAQEASEGWGGDEYVVAINDEETALVWDTEWDTEDDAEEFYTVLTTHEEKRFDANETEFTNSEFRFSSSEYSGEIRIDDTRVTYVLATDETLVGELFDNQMSGGESAASPYASPEATPVVPGN